MTDFDLRALIREVADTSSVTDPTNLAVEVLARIEPGQERAALEQALPCNLQQFVSRDHRANLGGSASQLGEKVGKSTDGSARSSKVSRIRNNWQAQLTARVNVGTKEWKFFGDCTLDDLNFMATHRRELAAMNISIADNLDGLSRLLLKHGVRIVRDLPERDVAALRTAA